MKENNREFQTTKELFQMIQQSPGRFAKGMKNGEEFNRPLTVPQYLEQLLEKYQMSISELITKTLLSKSFVYQIFSGERNPSRDILLRIAFAMHLTIDETQHLFLVGQKGALYPKVRRDAALMCCLEQRLSLDETEYFLKSIDEKGLV